MPEGRWWRLKTFETAAEAALLAWAEVLMDRYGVLTREVVALEPWAPSWAQTGAAPFTRGMAGRITPGLLRRRAFRPAIRVGAGGSGAWAGSSGHRNLGGVAAPLEPVQSP